MSCSRGLSRRHAAHSETLTTSRGTMSASTTQNSPSLAGPQLNAARREKFAIFRSRCRPRTVHDNRTLSPACVILKSC